MWPTYFIPMVLGGRRITLVFSLCSVARASPPPNVVSITHENLQPGDYLLAIMEQSANLQVATLNADWNILQTSQNFFSSTYSRSLSIEAVGDSAYQTPGLHAALWKFYSADDPDTFTFTAPNGGMRVCIFGLRGVDLDDPMPLVVRPSLRNSGGAIPGGLHIPPGRIPGMLDAVRVDVLPDNGTSAADTTADPNEYDLPTDDSVLAAGVMTQPQPGTTTELVSQHVSYVLRYVSDTEGANLIPSYPGDAGWTLTGVTYSLSTNARGYGMPKFQNGAGSTNHEIKRSLTCEAGKTYLFSALVQFTRYGVAIGYEIGGTFYGGIVQDNCALNSISNGAKVFRQRTAAGDVGMRVGVYLSFDSETTVDLVLGSVSSTFGRTYSGSGTSDFMHIPWIGVQEVPSDHYVPAMNDVDTEAATFNLTHACNPTNWARNNDATGANVFTNPNMAFSVLLKPSGETSPPVTLASDWLPNRLRRVSDTQTESTALNKTDWYTYENTVGNNRYWSCDRMAWPTLSNGQYYFEFTIDALSSAASDFPLFVLAPVVQKPAFAGALVDSSISLPPDAFPTALGFYAWSVRGRRADNLGNATGFTTLAAGDTVGVALDFVNGELKWYKNGALDHTDTFATGYGLYPWTIGFGIGPNSSTLTTQITVNATGPFGGRKPTGFVAWDFANEIT